MIRYECANCRRELEVDDDLAGQRAKCPHCGNIEVMAAMARARAVQASPAEARVPSSDSKPAPAPTTDRAFQLGLPPDSGPEELVRRVHPATVRARPVLASLVILGGCAGVILAVAAYTADTFASARWLAYVGGAITIAAAAWFGWLKLQSWGTTVTITNKRTTVRRGLLSRQTQELLHDQVQDLQVRQSFAQRLLYVGTLGIDGGGRDHVEIVIEGLPGPDQLKRIIDAYRPIG